MTEWEPVQKAKLTPHSDAKSSGSSLGKSAGSMEPLTGALPRPPARPSKADPK